MDRAGELTFASDSCDPRSLKVLLVRYQAGVLVSVCIPPDELTQTEHYRAGTFETVRAVQASQPECRWTSHGQGLRAPQRGLRA